MSQHKWKFGDWARLPNGVIARFVSEVNFCPAAEIYRYFLRKCGHIYHETEYEHLPDCDSFDWQPPKPIEPPEGYRLLSQGEKIRNWDMARLKDGTWIELLGDGPEGEQTSGQIYARKIEPRYRPFANAAELEPFKDKWITWKCNTLADGHKQKIGAFNNKVVWPACASTGTSLVDAFEKWQFEDGTPFGILDDAKPSGSGSK
jgi:hypothetical protein